MLKFQIIKRQDEKTTPWDVSYEEAPGLQEDNFSFHLESEHSHFQLLTISYLFLMIFSNKIILNKCKITLAFGELIYLV